MQLSDQLTLDLKAEHKAQKEIFTLLKDQYKEKVLKLEQQLEDIKATTPLMDNLPVNHQLLKLFIFFKKVLFQ